MKKKYIVLLFVVSLIFSFSCSEFEEGSIISLRSAKERIAGTWHIDQVLVNDLPCDSLINEEYQKYLTFSDSGNISIDVLRNEEVAQTLTGTWQYNPDNQNLCYLLDNDSVSQSFHITRLTNKEMWLVLEKSSDLRLESSIEKRYLKQ